MANLFDYLAWRADVPLSVDPFGEVDNLVLAELAYTDFAGLLSESGARPEEAYERFFACHTLEELDRSGDFTARAPLLMKDMMSGARFQDMVIRGYINEIDQNQGGQISAVTFCLPDGTNYVAFRGTDSTIVGWKEDFNLSYLDETLGQKRATAYLNDMAEQVQGPLRVGGHSKGGNFAVYASTCCEPDVQNRILEVYSNDGPGFNESFLTSQEYGRVKDRIRSIVPDSSVVGMLMRNACQRSVIRSSAAGILQHDALTWNVVRNRFEEASLSDLGVFFEEALGNWLDSLDLERRKRFTEAVFSVFEATDSETFHGIGEQKWKSLSSMILAMNGMPKEKQQELLRTIGKLLDTSRVAAINQIRERILPGAEQTVQNFFSRNNEG